MIEQRFEDAGAMVRALAGDIADRLEDGIVERGRASLVVTGGSTPGPLYEALSAIALPWSRVWITLSDERWVAPDDEASNERLVRGRLLRGKAAAAHFIPLKTDDATPAEAVEAVDARVAALPRPFEVVLLGIGEDGHFASLFPGNAALAVGLDAICADNVVAIEAAGAAGASQRLSLTLSALTDSCWIAVMATGEPKLSRLRAPGDTPIAALLGQDRVPVEIFWAP
jgi:6-phosphogluconolactonase